MMKSVLAILFAASFAVRLVPQEDAPLEPSVQNEVDHALDLGEKWLAAHATTNAVTTDLFQTNGRTRVQIALSLLRAQRAGGYWITPTNDAPTKLAVAILKGL